MGVMLIAIGVLMWLAENAGRKQRDLASVDLPDALSIGAGAGAGRGSRRFAQRHHHQRRACSATWTARAAARFSFLLSTPAIGAAAAKTLWDMHKAASSARPLTTNFVVGVGVSAVTGCVVIAWFLHYLRRSGLKPFAYYRIVFGIIVIALAFIRRPA